MRQIRIGIDVGGTFTDAVAIDNSTYEIVAQEKIPTTHNSKDGVAEGIIKVLQNILSKNKISQEEIIFIAHGTTQATNALLEGDVATTGILALGSGIEAARAKSLSNIENIPLATGKNLKTIFEFIETEDAKSSAQEVSSKIDALKNKGAEVIVATESYSVDDPTSEKFVIDMAREKKFMQRAGMKFQRLYSQRKKVKLWL